jgi:perosamine synthetase
MSQRQMKEILLCGSNEVYCSMNKKRYLKTLLTPWNYVNGGANNRLKNQLSHYYSGDIYPLINARSAQYIFLKSLNLPEGSKVAVQAFTCNAVINPILWLGLKPNYIDIKPDDFNMSLKSLKKRVDKDTKVVIIQHTFGIKNEETEEIVKFAKKRGIYVLEDLAHNLGDKGLGGFGDASIISFGVDKVISTTVGGALVVNNGNLTSNVQGEYSDIRTMGWSESMMLIFQPVFWVLGKILGYKWLKNKDLINIGYKESELYGTLPDEYPAKLSNGLTDLVLSEMKQLENNLEHRKIISKMYSKACSSNYDGISLLWYPYLAKDVDERRRIVEGLNNLGYRAGDWYRPAVYPSKKHLEYMKYKDGSCPVAEDLGNRIVGLETGVNIKAKDVDRIIDAVLGS